MMYSYPFRYPYYYGASFRRPHNSFSQPNASNDSAKPDNSCIADTTNSNKDKEEKCESVENRNALNFLGVTLYFDDLLLLALIYFLYKEDVQDPELFIALILLLLS